MFQLEEVNFKIDAPSVTYSKRVGSLMNVIICTSNSGLEDKRNGIKRRPFSNIAVPKLETPVRSGAPTTIPIESRKKRNIKLKKMVKKNEFSKKVEQKGFLQRIFDWENYSYIKKKLTITNTPLRLLK